MEPNNLATAFTIWAAVVGLVGAGVVFELSRLRAQLSDVANRLHGLTVDFEHRLTALEVDVARCQVRLKE